MDSNNKFIDIRSGKNIDKSLSIIEIHANVCLKKIIHSNKKINLFKGVLSTVKYLKKRFSVLLKNQFLSIFKKKNYFQ
jgi:hypothetical protein